MRYYFLDIKPCHVNPCKNGGSCIVNGGSFQCHCMQGYTGLICEGKINFTVFLWKHNYKLGKLLTNETQQYSYFLDHLNHAPTAQKMKFSIKDFFSKYEQIRRKLRIWSHLLKKSLMENFIFLCSDRCTATLTKRCTFCVRYST